MTRTRRLIVGMVLVAAATAGTALACGPSQVCRDAATSFVGEVIIDGIRLQWSTSAESGISQYKIQRYNCANPVNCSVEVATVAASGTCPALASYSYTDYPPEPLNQWTYTVEAWRVDGSRACALDTQLQ